MKCLELCLHSALFSCRPNIKCKPFSTEAQHPKVTSDMRTDLAQGALQGRITTCTILYHDSSCSLRIMRLVKVAIITCRWLLERLHCWSEDLVVNRKILVALSGKTFLWDFHECGSLLLTSSLSGTLYLSLLHLACTYHHNRSKRFNDVQHIWQESLWALFYPCPTWWPTRILNFWYSWLSSAEPLKALVTLAAWLLQDPAAPWLHRLREIDWLGGLWWRWGRANGHHSWKEVWMNSTDAVRGQARIITDKEVEILTGFPTGGFATWTGPKGLHWMMPQPRDQLQ